MENDRQAIHKIIGRMFENSDRCGIYPTKEVYDELEKYILKVRMQVLGWAHADACIALDKGEDPRKKLVPDMVAEMKRDFNLPGQQQ